MVKDSGSLLTTEYRSHTNQQPPLVNEVHQHDPLWKRCGGDSTDDRGPSPPSTICEDDTQPTIEIRRGIKWGPTLLMHIKINETSVEAVVDTGAEVTILSEDFFTSIAPDSKETAGRRINLHNAEDGSTMSGRRIEITIQMGDYSTKCEAFVAPIRENVLLGLDLLQAADVTIRARGAIYVQNKPVQSRMISRGMSHATSAIRLHKDVILQPHTEHIVWGEAVNPCPGKEAVLNPMYLPPQDVMVAAALVNMDAQVPVRIANFSDNQVKLKAGLFLGDMVESIPRRLTPSQEARREVDTQEDFQINLLSSGGPPEIPSYLQDLQNRSSEELEEDHKTMLTSVLSKYENVFARNDTDLGHFSAVKHRINTGNARPIRQPARRTPLGFEGEEEKHLETMLAAGIVEPSQSDWASPVVLVRKKDGSVRWCIDYRRLNAVTEKDAYPLPKIEECLDTLSGATLFSTLDLQSGYWQVEMQPEDRSKTAFITKHGLFQHTRMPFGLCNAPGTFQRAMELALRGLQWKTLLIYLDDIIIVSASFQDHLDRLSEVLERLEQHGLKLKPKKCHLLQKEVLFLGHIVNQHGVQTNPMLVHDIQQRMPPRTLRELQAFLGLCNYYRRFVPHFAAIAGPLNRLLAKGTEFTWGPEQQQAFEELKNRLLNTPVLAYPERDGIFILDTDASDSSIGAVLSQEQSGEERVVSYASSQLEPAQQRYCVTRRELLAVVRYTRMFRHYLLGKKFVLRTDHSSLTWLFRFKAPQGQLARWLEELSQYDFAIEHRAGRKHGNADAMSRLDVDDPDRCDCYRAGQDPSSLPCAGCSHCVRLHEQWERFDSDVDYVVPIAIRRSTVEQANSASDLVSPWLLDLTPAELLVKQMDDDVLKVLHQWMADGLPSKEQVMLEGAALKRYWLCWPQISKQQEVLYYQWEDSNGQSSLKLLVPKALTQLLIKNNHDPPSAGHPGPERTLGRIRQKYHWYGMRQDVEWYVKQCASCAATKHGNRSIRAHLQQYHAGCPMERIHMDILGPFPESDRGNKYILVIMDQFTKWVEAYPVPDQSAETTARTLVMECLSKIGAPLAIHTDQGRNFESGLFKGICRLFQIAKTRTTPYHPASNGQVERFNRTLLQMLRCYVHENHRDWDVYLPLLTSAYRAVPHSTTGFSPNRMMLGREVNMPGDLNTEQAKEIKPGTTTEYVQELTENLESIHSLAREHLKSAQQRQKRNYDVRATENAYTIGDLVFVRDSTKKKGHSPKLQKIWAGPAIVIKRLGPVLYQLRERKSTRVLHHDRLKPYHSAVIPHWISRFRASLDLGTSDSSDTCQQEATCPKPGSLPPMVLSSNDATTQTTAALEMKRVAGRRRRAAKKAGAGQSTACHPASKTESVPTVTRHGRESKPPERYQ